VFGYCEIDSPVASSEKSTPRNKCQTGEGFFGGGNGGDAGIEKKTILSKYHNYVNMFVIKYTS
jgi:hypothetical protein